jgi:F0F1-type ATP synthase assembly protein I
MAGNSKEALKLLTVFGTIGLTMASCVFIGFGVGYYLDNKIFAGKTSPWLTFLFLGFGIFAGFKNLLQMSKRKDL